MSNFLDEKRKEIGARLKELEPYVAEYKQLEAASNALAGVAPVPASSPTPTATPAPAAPRARATRAPRAATAGKPAARRGRPRGSGARAQEALTLVSSRPGITIPELAEAMGIKQNYLYRVMPSLEKDRKVVKRDRGWHAVK